MRRKNEVEKFASEVVDSGLEVHRTLGPGLLESAYQKSLEYELISRGLAIDSQRPLPLEYKKVKMECGYRMDIVVENSILIEIKSIENIAPIHKAQIITYLKLSNIKLGFLINFNVSLFKNGVQRIVNNY